LETKSWTVGGNACSGTVPQTPDGQQGTATNTLANYSGSATFACSNSAWGSSPTGSATCVRICAVGTISRSGARQNKNTTVTMTPGFTCTTPTFTSYSCSNTSAINSGTTVTLTSSSNTPASASFTVTNACALQ
jgi:hypothetical protein